MDRFDTARALVLAAGACLRLARPKAGAVWEKTGHQDLVTRCDRETEQFLRSGILSAFPGDAIVGEEYPATPPGGTGCVWYLDPIDGTTNFVSQHRNYAVSVGCYQDGVPAFGLVLDVERGALYSARHGGGALRDETPIHVSHCGVLRDALLTTPGVLHTFLREHPRRAGLVELAGAVRGVRSMGVWHWSCAPWPRVKQSCLWRCVRVHGTTTRRASFWLRPEAVSVRWTEPLCRRTRAAQCLRPVPARFWNRCSPAFPQIRQAGRTVDAPFARPRPRHCTDVFWTVYSP